jgi:hypothetical protein
MDDLAIDPATAHTTARLAEPCPFVIHGDAIRECRAGGDGDIRVLFEEPVAATSTDEATRPALVEVFAILGQGGEVGLHFSKQRGRMDDRCRTELGHSLVCSVLEELGHRVMLDADLALLYEVEAKVLNQAVKRNIERFPADFMFQLSVEEAAFLRSQNVTLKPGRGQHRKYLPYAFTEQGVAMLSGVLHSPRAVMRAFVRLRQMLQQNADLARKLAQLEKKYDTQFRAVFDAIRELMKPLEKPKRRIGFGGGDRDDG